MSEHDSSFKIVDKRRFSENGDVKDSNAESEAKKEAIPAIPSANSEKREKITLDFSLFIQSLAHQAYMGMGLVAWPDSNLIKANFEAAKETIDILGVLQQKTKGNLDADEAQLLEGLLYQLRMTFVKVLQTPAPGTSPAKS